MPTSSASTERNWSIHGFIHSNGRNQLGLERVGKLVGLYANRVDENKTLPEIMFDQFNLPKKSLSTAEAGAEEGPGIHFAGDSESSSSEYEEDDGTDSSLSEEEEGNRTTRKQESRRTRLVTPLTGSTTVLSTPVLLTSSFSPNYSIKRFRMGNSNSADLETQLQSPSCSMRALDASWITKAPTCLHIRVSLGGIDATVTDTATDAPVYSFKDKFLSSRSFLKGPEDQTLITIKSSTFSCKFRIFSGDQTEHEQFILRDASGIFQTMLLTVEYYDNKTGCPCRVVARGSPSKRVVVCYLETGSPRLSQLKSSEDFQTNFSCYRPIGRFSRDKKFLGRDEYEVEAPAGVDVTLLLLIWHARQILLVIERSSSSG